MKKFSLHHEAASKRIGVLLSENYPNEIVNQIQRAQVRKQQAREVIEVKEDGEKKVERGSLVYSGGKVVLKHALKTVDHFVNTYDLSLNRIGKVEMAFP